MRIFFISRWGADESVTLSDDVLSFLVKALPGRTQQRMINLGPRQVEMAASMHCYATTSNAIMLILAWRAILNNPLGPDEKFQENWRLLDSFRVLECNFLRECFKKRPTTSLMEQADIPCTNNTERSRRASYWGSSRESVNTINEGCCQ